jgi:PPOX class probable F420-dependent enzyme
VLSDKAQGLIKGSNIGFVATVLPSGLIQNQPVWVDTDGEHVLVNTEVGRRKYKNLEDNDNITVTVIDSENPWSWVEVRGKSAGAIHGQEARDHIDELAKKYLGVDDYPNPIASPRVIIKVAPEQVFEFPPGG